MPDPISPPKLTLAEIQRAFNSRAHKAIPSQDAQRKAAVAVALHDGTDGLEMLFIQRAHHPEDPWSGHMAFPGGRQDPEDDSTEAAARRETYEEVGLRIAPDSLLARLSDVTGGRLADFQLSVSPYVYHCPVKHDLVLNHEVAAAVWVPVSHFSDSANVREYIFPPDPLRRLFPSFHYQGYTIWGLTYRIIVDFMQPLGVSLPLEWPVTDVE
ncbi:MAG: hypothetical protein AMXMBFR84_11320 [Candidatus Hydrogenedentota bacterium]